MTTVSRWWAPAAPGIGPDETDLRLLTPGQEAEKDLGQAFLALHRVGAAACEAVATQPLADEVSLLAVLAKAREMVAPPAVEMISKAVDDKPYAGLLVRDLLNDAENAALSLFRTCVAKHVPPAMAAQRVGMVFGVPLRELGRFTTLAADPRSMPAMLTDSADRALFGYVSKLLEEEEVTERKVEISKAPTERERARVNPLQQLFDQAEQKQREDWHGKDPGERDMETGQFVARGRASERRRASERTSARGRASDRVKASDRQKASARTLGEVKRSTEQRELERASLGRADLKRGSLARGDLSRAQLETQKIIDKPFVDTNQAGLRREVPDTLARAEDPNDPQDYTDLNGGYAFVLPADEWLEYERATGELADKTRVWRIGSLAEYSGTGHVYRPEDTGDEDHPEIDGDHEFTVASTVERIATNPELDVEDAPLIKIISPAEAKGNLRGAKESFLKDLEGTLGPLNRAKEITRIQSAGLAGGNGEVVLVYRRQGRVIPHVVEVIVPDGGVSGIDHSYDEAKNRDITLDPNAVMTSYTALDSRFEDTSATFWTMGDDGDGYLRTTITVKPGYQMDANDAIRRRTQGETGRRGFRKASERERSRVQVTNLQQLFDQAAQREQDYHGKDPGERDMDTGQFVRVRASDRAKASSRGGQRMRASARVAQAPAALQRPLERRDLQRSDIDQQDLERVALDRKQLAAVEVAADAQPSSQQTVFLEEEGYRYKVLTAAEADEYLAAGLQERDAFIAGPNQAIALREGGIKGKRARVAFLENTDNDFLKTPFPSWGGLVEEIARGTVVEEADFAAIAADTFEQLVKNEGRQVMSVLMTKDPSSNQWTVSVRANKTGKSRNSKGEVTQEEVGLPPQHVFRVEDGQRVQAGSTWVNEGAKRVLNAKGIESWLKLRWARLNLSSAEGASVQDRLPNPVVYSWRLADDSEGERRGPHYKIPASEMPARRRSES